MTRILLDEHLPPNLALAFQALGLETRHVVDPELDLRGRSDGDLLRQLSDLDCDYLATLDQYRQPEVWSDVYTLLAEGTGRVLRITPRQRPGISGTHLVAWLTRHLVDAYDDWSPHLANEQIALIDLGRAPDGTPRSIMKYSALTRAAVGRILQQQLKGH